MTVTLEHATTGRSTRTVIILIMVYTVLASLVLVVDAAPWLMAILALTTLPALWDLYSNRSAGLVLDDSHLHWHTGRRSCEIALREIDHMRFDTRWDFSVRVSAILPNKKRIRLPYEALPPHKTLESAFEARQIRVDRHHFSIL